MYHSFIKMDQDHVPYIYLVGMLRSNACMKQRFMTLMTTCESAWCKLCLTLSRSLLPHAVNCIRFCFWHCLTRPRY